MANKRIHELTADSTPDADACLVLDKSTYAAPVKSTVTQLLQNLPVAPQTAGGNARGRAAVDLQITRSADAQVASGAYATIGGGSNNTASANTAMVSGGNTNTASGISATVPGGYGNVASGDYSTALGIRAVADKYSQLAFAGGSGNAQFSLIQLFVQTDDATPTVFVLADEFYITIPASTAWLFRADIAGITGDAAAYGAYTVTGLVRRNVSDTVSVHGVATTTVTESAAGWDATAVADDTNKALSIQVTGAAATTIKWAATLQLTEVTYD